MCEVTYLIVVTKLAQARHINKVVTTDRDGPTRSFRPVFKVPVVLKAFGKYFKTSVSFLEGFAAQSSSASRLLNNGDSSTTSLE